MKLGRCLGFLGLVALAVAACESHSTPSATTERAVSASAPEAASLATPSALPPPSASVASAEPSASASSAPEPDLAPKTKSGGVRLLSAGAEPRQKLRYALTAGSTQKVDMTTKSQIKMTLAGRTANAPAAPGIKLLAVMRVLEVTPDGVARRSLGIEKVSLVDAPGVTPELKAQVKDALSSLEKLRGKDEIDSRGNVRSASLDASGVDDAKMQSLVGALGQTFGQMAAPFPEEEVGVGAKWQVKTHVEQIGLALAQIATYELVELGPKQGKLKVKIQQSAPAGEVHPPGLPAGARAELLGMKGTGTGELRIDFARAVPAGKIDTHAEVKVKTTLATEAQELGLDMTASVVFEPRQP